MSAIDWRELYAQNRAVIAASGIGPSARAARTPPLPHARGDVLGAGRRRSTLRRGSHEDSGLLVHVPPDLNPSVPVAAACMLHGCTQDPAAFAAATEMNDTADRHGFVVVYPGQPRARNAQGCWNWFLPAHQQRGAGEPELIAGVVRRLVASEFGQAIDPAQVFVAGLSSGGAMALILAACYPDLFAAVAVHSGLAYRSAHDVASAFDVMRRGGEPESSGGHRLHAAMGEHGRPVPSMVIHGTADRTVAPGNARRILAELMHANHLAAPQRCRHDPARPTAAWQGRADGGLSYTHSQWVDMQGALMHESIEVLGLGHAWSGGAAGGSHTDPRGPSASEAIWTFFSKAARHHAGVSAT